MVFNVKWCIWLFVNSENVWIGHKWFYFCSYKFWCCYFVVFLKKQFIECSLVSTWVKYIAKDKKNSIMVNILQKIKKYNLMINI